MNRSISIPNVSFLRNRQPSLAEIEYILDFLPDAALLLDLEKRRVLLTNAKATELTAFTRDELINKDLVDLLPFLSNHIQEFSQSSKPETYIDTLATRSSSNIEVRVNLTGLDQDCTWGLVTIEPAADREVRLAQKRRARSRLGDIKALVSAAKHTESQFALRTTLETGHHLTGADILALYLVRADKPGLDKVMTWGGPNELPKAIDSEEISEFLSDICWTPGTRASNSLSRTGRSSNLSYLRSFPLGEKDSFIGLLVLGAYDGEQPEDNTQLIEILSSTIIGIIQNNNTRENLLNEKLLMEQGLLIGETIRDATQDGIILLSPDLDIKELNPQAETLLGYATQEVQGQSVNNVLIGPSNLIPALQSAQQGLATPNLGEVHLHRRDGVAFLAHISTIPLTFEDQLSGILILLRDLSAHEEFEIQNQQLEQRALLGEVTAIFAHEVRNPINNISTGLQLMASNLPEEDPNQEVIARLKDDCTRLTDLMQSVLTFSRPPENKYKKVDLEVLLPSLLERWRPRLARLKVNHEFKSFSDNSMIIGDSRSLEQVFSNLIGNAVEAMKSTGGSLSIHVRPSHPEGGREHIEVNVIDEGTGIPADLVDRIFEPFITTNRNGTGLGLSIAKRIVTAHKGTISVSSVPGGTVFQVRFPLKQDTEV
jgi:PAS domain S-box-containing protein